MAQTSDSPLHKTPLHALHLELGARMVPFAGYDMPVQYKAGLMAEHKQCREQCALFDVSHMGQVALFGAEADAALETLIPVDVVGLAEGKQRYGFFTREDGGILDDLMFSRPQGEAKKVFGDIFVIVNAGCKAQDIAHMKQHIGNRVEVKELTDRALLALQGPKAAEVLGRLNPAVRQLVFMSCGIFDLVGASCCVSRSGYTGEDGYEISVPVSHAEQLARALLAEPECAPAGLGARDTLRLEAGMCLYGHDITPETNPVEAGLTWGIQKVRRAGGARAGGYPGAAAIDALLADGSARKRVGLVGKERAPVREGTPIVDANGNALGLVTSGTLGPTLNKVIAMAYLPASHAALGTEVFAQVRGKLLPMTVASMPFVPNNYYRG